MKTFRLTADAEFQAENIDDAFQRLAQHFALLAAGGEPAVLTAGTVLIEPVKRAISKYQGKGL